MPSFISFSSLDAWSKFTGVKNINKKNNKNNFILVKPYSIKPVFFI